MTRRPRRCQPVVVDGIRFKSKFEGAVYKAAKADGHALEYETERINYTLWCVYRPDFKLPNGVLVEAKGAFPADDRRKMIAVRDAGWDVRLLFQNANNKIRKGAKTTVAQWADQNGFVWAEGPEIPEEWYEDGPTD
jgi:hypothetical protein